MLNTYIGHLDYIVLIFLSAGAGMLLVDTKKYNKQKMLKEKKAARSLGWVNLAIGTASMVASWFLGK